ncbi:HAMP domain-containing histidine kinase [Pseudoalteromonas luteoviolacea]|uniref:sensor histidine kinase n=1 Tax=Pseudoalteromonas luteoviolacea TaxID=43657 RepID=UPI001B36280C|nr:HAMP domain-containing sensor histidine kinase [Pseudoalteromonas luteoviolacea]MBQ4812444.1 HAMP domain-containing histidine kinase [Pseudoalteromonas luteoviolacea]
MKKRIHIFWHFYLGILLSIVTISLFTIAYFSHIGEEYAIRAFVIDAKQVASYANANAQQAKINDFDWSLEIDKHGLRVSMLEADGVLDYLAPMEFVAQVDRTDVYIDPKRDIYISLHPMTVGNGFLIVREIDFEKEFDKLNTYQKNEIKLNDEEDALNTQFQMTIIIGFIVAIALTLLVLLTWLKKFLRPIQQASLKWREGNLATRIDVTSPEPFYTLFVTMNKMAEDLENLIEEQKVMSFAMSHELRNPLNGLSLAIEVVAREHDYLKDDPAYNKLRRYASELENLSLNILTLAKVSNVESHATFETCNFSNLVAERVEFYSQSNPKIQYQSEIEPDLKLNALPLYLELIVDNIISNAARYTKSMVTTKLQLSEKWVELIVIDNGPGIAPEQLDFAMMPFSRLDHSRSKSSGGFGLGLAIVGSAVKRLAGTIELTNNVSQGLTVRVKLPNNTH